MLKELSKQFLKYNKKNTKIKISIVISYLIMTSSMAMSLIYIKSLPLFLVTCILYTLITIAHVFAFCSNYGTKPSTLKEYLNIKESLWSKVKRSSIEDYIYDIDSKLYYLVKSNSETDITYAIQLMKYMIQLNNVLTDNLNDLNEIITLNTKQARVISLKSKETIQDQDFIVHEIVSNNVKIPLNIINYNIDKTNKIILQV